MSIDDYLKNVSPSQRKMLERIRVLVKQIVPEAVESVSYGVPTFKYNKRPLLYFGAFKHHMSVFPASDDMIAAIGKELEKFRTSKGTLQFTLDNPIPEPMMKKIIQHRLADIVKLTKH